MKIIFVVVTMYPGYEHLRVKYDPFWKCLRLRDSAWDFSGVNFWFRDFLGG